MYSVFLDGWRFPVTPSKLEIKIKGKNKTLTLVNDGEINFLKTPGLTEIDNLEVVFPTISSYPFAVYTNGFKSPEYFLSKLETLMVSKKPAQFIVSRVSPDGKLLFSTNMKVSLEEYTIKESASNGPDVTVSLKLKQYRDFATKTINIEIKPVTHINTTSNNTSESSETGGEESGGTTGGTPPSSALKAPETGDVVDFTGSRHYVSSTGDKYYPAKPGKAKVHLISNGAKHPYCLIHIDASSNVCGWVDAADVAGAPSASTAVATAETVRDASTAPKAKSYTVNDGDTLWTIAKKCTGDGAKYKELYNANKSNIRNPSRIYKGQVLTLPW